ncbi:hypothetical protein G3N59_35400 [Paraburkholderia sp. Ac-20340]|uniref:TnsD family Tn7-like transposition protein n=1 Tax=Paraburkholderia sp. Ac-20340 TaxID=2703888 RepID=UPI00197E47F1|nr:TnsD family Tn7-like transposition protein [Paraburkholderia sp. Ac-20340]MBN3858691.1 hypothetical protein [Paraburkholderia sp. Ac-20340]
MAIALFPLCDGEGIGSNFGRYAEYMNLSSTRILRKRLFGYPCKPGTRLPCSVSYLAEQTRDYWNLKAQEIIDNHTEFRYATMMASSKIRGALLEKMLGPPTSTSIRLNICGLRGELVPRLRYCEQCLAEWRDARRQPFWKMDHQLPGVYFCTEHLTVLKFANKSISEMKMDSPVADVFQATDEFVLRQSTPAERAVVADVALRSVDQRALNRPSKSQRAYQELLRDAGFATTETKISYGPLVREWLAYFGAEYCQLTSMSEQKIYSWATSATGRVGGSEFPHPFMFLAAESFFEHRLKSLGSFVPAIGVRKENCAVVTPVCRGDDDVGQLGQLVCSAALHRDSDSFKIFGKSKKSGRWKVVCSCGVTYFVKESLDVTSPRMKAVRYGLKYQQHFQTMMARGTSINGAARELGLSPKTALEWKRQEVDSVTVSATDLRRLRAEWREFVESAPSRNRIVSATRMGRATRSKLERFDREWLLEFNRQNGSLRRGVKDGHRRTNVRSNARSELFRQTQLKICAASDLLKRVEPPVHVSRAAIARKAGLRESAARDSPFSGLLAELSESRAAYSERVIVWMTALSKRQPLRNFEEVRTLTGLYRTSFSEEQRVRICRLLSREIEAVAEE